MVAAVGNRRQLERRSTPIPEAVAKRDLAAVGHQFNGPHHAASRGSRRRRPIQGFTRRGDDVDAVLISLNRLLSISLDGLGAFVAYRAGGNEREQNEADERSAHRSSEAHRRSLGARLCREGNGSRPYEGLPEPRDHPRSGVRPLRPDRIRRVRAEARRDFSVWLARGFGLALGVLLALIVAFVLVVFLFF